MWVLPTLGRPEICQRALDSIIAVGCTTAGMVVVDGDPDPRYRQLRLPPGWLRALGWWTPPGLFHCFADDAWEEIIARLGNRQYLRDIIVEHWHADNGKAERDATYRHAYGRLEADRRVWMDFRRESMPGAIDRVARARGGRAVPSSIVPAPAILALTASANPGYVGSGRRTLTTGASSTPLTGRSGPTPTSHGTGCSTMTSSSVRRVGTRD
jgi:hypothetical protein